MLPSLSKTVRTSREDKHNVALWSQGRAHAEPRALCRERNPDYSPAACVCLCVFVHLCATCPRVTSSSREKMLTNPRCNRSIPASRTPGQKRRRSDVGFAFTCFDKWTDLRFPRNIFLYPNNITYIYIQFSHHRSDTKGMMSVVRAQLWKCPLGW